MHDSETTKTLQELFISVILGTFKQGRMKTKATTKARAIDVIQTAKRT